MKQFKSHYKIGRDTKQAITREAIFHYVYAVLHDPHYRDKYAHNLKRELPRIPFYADFQRWAAWGEALMSLHIDYENVKPWDLGRVDEIDATSRAGGMPLKPSLRPDRENGIIIIDAETRLVGIPPQAWDCRLGNRSALEWVLDQYKEKTPKDATLREHFNNYSFTDHKEKVIDLLMRVTRVSVETVLITDQMRSIAQRD